VNKKVAIRRCNEVEARNKEMSSVAPKYVFGGERLGVKEFGNCLARHVRDDELHDTDDNMGLGLVPLLNAKNDVAVFAWFERNFGEAVTEYVDAIDDGLLFLSGVYAAQRDGTLARGK